MTGIPDTARRAALAVTLLTSALLAILAPSAASAAEASVTVGPSQVSAALFVAGDVSRLSGVPAGTEDLILEKALQQLYADEPELAPATAEGYVRDMQAALAAPSAPSPASLQLMAGNQRILAILAALERPYGSPAATLPAPAKLAVTHLAAVALSGASDIFASAEEPKYFEPLADERTNLTFTSFAPATVLRATHALAATDHGFGEARDALWGKVSEESVFSGWSELLAESGVLQSAALQELREAIEAGSGTLTETPAQLTALFTAGQVRTQEQSCAHGGTEEAIGGESIVGVPRLKCSGGALYEAAHAARTCTSECLAHLEARESAAAARQRAISEERARMIAASELLRPSDNAAAALAQATAQAQTQITEEETAWASYEAQKAEREQIAGAVKEGLGAGTAVLALATGNYSEGVGGLINVGFEIYEKTEEGLSKPPPGPQEITLQALADLSTQLAGFQQYTQQAFHAINTQLAKLSSQLARENHELGEHLSQLGERLVREQGTIYALQNEVQTLFAAQTKANLQQTIEDSVGWLSRTGEPLAGASFQQSLVALKKYATEIANGALVNNAETQPYNFEGAFRQLAGGPSGEPAQLSEDISYLARFPGEQAWPSPLAPATLANTTFFSESSRAYAQLMLENAGHATSADIAGLGALENEARKLEKTEGAWSQDSAPGSQTGNAILSEALARFEAAAFGGGVDATISVGELLAGAAKKSFGEALKKYVNPGSPTPNPTGLNLWGGAEQSFNASQVHSTEYPALKWQECSGSATKNGAQEMPEPFIESLPAALVDGVRLGVIGAPGSGDPLILRACRTITKASPTDTSTIHAERYEEPCSVDVENDCKVFYEGEATNESEPETVKETLTLQEGEGGATLAAPSVGECKQSSLWFKGKGYFESWDPTTKGAYGAWVEKTSLGGSFESERHIGTAESVYFTSKDTHWTYSQTAIAGIPCPYPIGAKEAAGIEYAMYGENATSPLASAEPAIVEKIDAKLRELQQEAYAAGLTALKNPPNGNPAESLAGARALIQSYVKLGLPQALSSDVILQSNIEGTGAQFLDPEPEPAAPRPLPQQLRALIGSWIGRLENAGKPKEPSLERMVGEDLIDEVQARSSTWAKAVAEEVKPYVEGRAEGFDTGSEEPVGETSALVESTLNRMQLTRDVLGEARAPTAETLSPSEVGATAATVRGEVDSNGGTVESCVFEYGATSSYGHHVECSAVPSASEKAMVVSAKIADWTPEGSFHERVVMKTWGGTSYGQDVKVQLAQSTKAPSGGMLLASTGTSGAAIGAFTAEELPAGVALPEGVTEIVGMVRFTVNVTPGAGALVKIELPSGDAVPNALYKLRRNSGGGEEYAEIPTSLYKINGNVIELTLVDGGPDDEDGEVNGVIVDPLVPAIVARRPATPPSPTTPPASTPALTPSPAAPPSAAGTGSHARPHHRRHHARRQCVNHDHAIVNLTSIRLPHGTRILRSRILLHGRIVARLGGRAKEAMVSFAGQRKGPYVVKLVAKLSNGHTLRRKIAFHNCVPVIHPPHQCVRGGRVAVRLSALRLPRKARIERSRILLHGRIVARLGRRAKGAVIRLPRRKHRYVVKLIAKLSNGHTLQRRIVFRPCARVAG